MIQIIPIRNHPELAERAAEWFNQKWRTPLEAYKESIADCLSQMNAVPQWYLAMEGNVISGGLGVIENDFHNRRDLAPNVCAVFVEEDFRCQGIAGKMLDGNSYVWYRGTANRNFQECTSIPRNNRPAGNTGFPPDFHLKTAVSSVLSCRVCDTG